MSQTSPMPSAQTQDSSKRKYLDMDTEFFTDWVTLHLSALHENIQKAILPDRFAEPVGVQRKVLTHAIENLLERVSQNVFGVRMLINVPSTTVYTSRYFLDPNNNKEECFGCFLFENNCGFINIMPHILTNDEDVFETFFHETTHCINNNKFLKYENYLKKEQPGVKLGLYDLCTIPLYDELVARMSGEAGRAAFLGQEYTPTLHEEVFEMTSYLGVACRNATQCIDVDNEADIYKQLQPVHTPAFKPLQDYFTQVHPLLKDPLVERKMQDLYNFYTDCILEVLVNSGRSKIMPYKGQRITSMDGGVGRMLGEVFRT